MNSTFFQRGVDIVSKAIDADNKGEYKEAYDLYMTALENFVTGLKYEQNHVIKEKVTSKVRGYMERAEALKKALSEPAAPAKSAAAAGSAGEGEADGESSKLRGALASAIVSEKPNVSWDDVAGLESAKDTLKEAVILPVRFPDLFKGKRQPWKGILLYGPPGTGKSYLAKAVATEADATFFSISSADLVSKWQGESEKLVRNLFQMAREHDRAIIFIDEIDSLCGSRSEGENDSSRRIKTEFLVQMQGMGSDDKHVLVLGATNVPWEIDAAMRRRFQKRIYIPLPEQAARAKMAQLSVGDTPNELTAECFNDLGAKTEGFSGSDMAGLVQNALMEPLRRCQTATHFRRHPDDGKYEPCSPDAPGAIRMSLFDIDSSELRTPVVTARDFDAVIGRSTTSVSKDEMVRFEKWTTEFGEDGL